MNPIDDIHVRDTRRWLERAVIGLNLCPFAKAVHVKNGVHYAVSNATDPDQVLADVCAELDALAALDPQVRETTLLIVPHCLQDFVDFNDFVGRAERALRKRGLEGTLQLASFHPRFQFAGAAQDDITNFTNRSPYPVIHLLRESSIDRAVDAFPHPETIYETNMETLRRIGIEGWNALQVGPSA
jgi:hypothetical protein